MRAVLNGSIDIGIVSGEIDTQSLQSIHFNTDELMTVVPNRHPLAMSKSVKLIDTLSYPHIGLHRDSTLQHFMNEKFIQTGLTFEQRIHVLGFDAMCRLIESNVGIGVIPKSVISRIQKYMNIRMIKLDEIWAKRQRNIVIKSFDSLPPLAKALVNCICQAS